MDNMTLTGKLLRTFRKEGQTLQDFHAELAELTPGDREELAIEFGVEDARNG